VLSPQTTVHYNILVTNLTFVQILWSFIILLKIFLLQKFCMVTKPWNFPCNLKRRDEVDITRARVGHTHLTHSFLITKEPASLCDTCNVNLSINHIITRCPKYSAARTIFKNTSSLQLALSKENTEAIYNFFYYIRLNHKLNICKFNSVYIVLTYCRLIT